ncbi:MAG: toll/interleukin-1 receptor domain-containing protein [Anaerolineae bacterium]|nr:toll/interleukin-1 receptor domain-containing protein [Anaerolineae bacterium]
MITITHASADAELAARLSADLSKHGETSSSAEGKLLIAILSPEGSSDADVQAAIIRALDNGQHIIPVVARPVPLPKLIDHLTPIDFTTAYDVQSVVTRIKEHTAPGAASPLKVRTPKVKAANQRYGYWLTILALIWFTLAVLMIGIGGLRAPVEEYNTIETQVAATIAIIIRENLPRSTEDALNFPATVQAAPTAQRPALIATATAMVVTPTRSR